jgi:hypothetical protein
MDATNQIVAEAATVAEARRRAERRVPRGMQVLGVKENWPQAGTVRAGGDDPASASENARAKVPPGAVVTGETVRPAGEAIYVYAADERRAAERLRGGYGDALATGPDGSPDGEVGPLLSRTAGPFGHSDGLVQFRAELGKPVAEVSYRTKARVALTFGPEPLARVAGREQSRLV